MDHTPFLTAFPGCADFSELCGGLKKAYITAVQVSEAERTISVSAWFPAMPSPVETSSLTERIRSDYDLRSVSLQPDFPKPASSVTEAAGVPGSAVGVPQPAGSVLYGRAIRQTPVPMSSLTLESGRVTVEGDVFAVSSRALQKRGGAVLSFDMTDRTNSVRVSRYLRSEDDQSILDKIKEGDHLTVQGEISYSKFDDDMVLEPRNIVKGKKTVRPDNAPEKRVELHMHTRFSALDALTDPEALIKRAAYWGMPAVAVTDHGVAQAFPDMWKYGKKNGVKVIYGLEAYYYEDARKIFHGDSDLPLDTETVAFDIETTGLNESTDRMTEIGAVFYAGGEIRDSFQTFVNPGMPIPQEITDLTGITDADVASAPGEKEALEAFLRFAGGRPLAAHNADFDTGFMRAAAARNGMSFDLPYLDTLVAAHHLLAELTRFKLDTVSNHL